jgi:hypothetical protein
MKKELFTISRPDDSPMAQVLGIRLGDYFALTNDPDDISSKCNVLTHIPSGRSAYRYQLTLSDARALHTALMQLDVPWQSDDNTTIVNAVKRCVTNWNDWVDSVLDAQCASKPKKGPLAALLASKAWKGAIVAEYVMRDLYAPCNCIKIRGSHRKSCASYTHELVRCAVVKHPSGAVATIREAY